MSKAGFSKVPHPYVPKCRRHESTPPSFMVRRLSPREISKAKIEAFGDETVDFKSDEKEQSGSVKLSFTSKLELLKYLMVEMAVAGWEHVDDEAGKPILFSKENVDCLDEDIIDELSEYAQGRISEKEEKNSDTPS